MHTPFYSYHVVRHCGLDVTARSWSEAGFSSKNHAIKFAECIHDGINFTSVYFIEPGKQPVCIFIRSPKG